MLKIINDKHDNFDTFQDFNSFVRQMIIGGLTCHVCVVLFCFLN